jgi:predicted DNA-binding protein (MmcQ/YjbR family)
MTVNDAARRIHDTVIRWEGVNSAPHRFGGTEYRVGRREIGHVHGNELVDIPFPKAIRDTLIANGEAENHHYLPESGWISFYIRSSADTTKAVALLKRSYDLANRKFLLRK